MEKILITLEPRRSPLKEGRLVFINNKKITYKIVKGMPGFRGATFYKGNLCLASPKSIRFFDEEFNIKKVATYENISEIHTIRNDFNSIIVVSTNKDRVYQYHVEGNKWYEVFVAPKKSHLNTLDNGYVMSLHSKVYDMGTGAKVWENTNFKYTHNFTRVLDGSIMFLSDNKVIKNDQTFYEEEGRFMRGLLVQYPFVYVGVNSFMERYGLVGEYRPCKVIKFHIDGNILETFSLDTARPWVIYDIIENEWESELWKQLKKQKKK